MYLHYVPARQYEQSVVAESVVVPGRDAACLRLVISAAAQQRGSVVTHLTQYLAADISAQAPMHCTHT